MTRINILYFLYFKNKIKTFYLKSVAFPVNGPKRISPNGGLNPRIVKASSCVIGFRLIFKEKDIDLADI